MLWLGLSSLHLVEMYLVAQAIPPKRDKQSDSGPTGKTLLQRNGCRRAAITLLAKSQRGTENIFTVFIGHQDLRSLENAVGVALDLCAVSIGGSDLLLGTGCIRNPYGAQVCGLLD